MRCVFFGRPDSKSCLCKRTKPVSYTHLRAHETSVDLVCRLLLEKENVVVILMSVILFFWPGRGKKGMYIKYFHLKIPSLFVLCSLLTSCVAESVKNCVRKKKKNYMMTNISYYNK